MEIGTVLGALLLLLALSQFGKSVREVKPNPSFMKQVPAVEEILNMPESNRKKACELFTELQQKSPELAEELGRIPDFADNDISDKDLEALVNISGFYSEAKNPKIKEAFKEILNVGIKSKRAYCSPLEALKWLTEKHEFEEGSYVDDPLSYYTLAGLVRFAWDFDEKERWSNFKETTSRLNSPELVQFWMGANLKYIADPRTHGTAAKPWTTFRRKGGDCEDWAIFASYCLAKAGYDTYILSVGWKPRSGHSVAVYKENNRLFVVGDTDSKRRIHGPYSSNGEVVKRVLGRRELRRVNVYKWFNAPG